MTYVVSWQFMDTASGPQWVQIGRYVSMAGATPSVYSADFDRGDAIHAQIASAIIGGYYFLRY